jgi:protease-4
MKNSKLLTCLIKGKWMITHEESIAKAAIVKKLMDGDFIAEDYSKMLSEEKPLMNAILAASGMGGSFDDAPKGSTAIIPIGGTMLKYGTYCSYGTEEIAAEITKAANHRNIDAIILDIDSGGGAVDAIAPLVDAIEKCSKPVVASCDLCASAAYWAATACDRIVANNNISAEFGSIGVMMSFQDVEPYYKDMGVITHTIYSNHSDYKNKPFQLAKEGKYDEIKTEELDPLAIKFQSQVKTSRGEKLNTEIPGILQGRMFGPEEAKAYGLIDEVGNLDTAVQIARDLTRSALVNNYLKQ